ncbi:MAG: ABC transporter permease [Chloroflexi bacterium]|nr:ABC transporter permease [Chloroflexota bacterium]
MLTFFPWLAPFFLALRNMRTRIGRTLLTLMGIVLGVAVVLAIQITNQSTLDSINQVFDRAAGQADLLVVPALGGQDKLDEALLPQTQALDKVQTAAPSIQVYTILAMDAESWQIDFTVTGISAGNSLQIYGIDPILDPQVRVYEIEVGRLPKPEAYETVIPASYAEEKGLKLGDDLVVLTSGETERFEIVGLLAEEGVALLNDGVVALAPLTVVQDIFDHGGELDEIALRLIPGLRNSPAALEEYKATLEQRLDNEGRVIYPAARGELVSSMLATYQQGLSFFSLIAIFVGAFLIYNTFTMTIVERTREIGMLRAIGMNRFRVIGMVLAEALTLSVVGSLIGLAAGVGLARGLMGMMGVFVNTGEQVLTITSQGLTQSLSVGVGVTLAASLLPAVQAARISPIAALRVRAHSTESVRPIIWISGMALLFVGWAMIYRIDWRPALQFPMGSGAILLIMLGATLTVPVVVALLEGVTRPLASALYGNEGSIGSSNVRRSVGRTALTVASLMVALAMIIGVGSLAYAFEVDMGAWIDTALGGDLYVRSPLVMRETFGRQLANIPGVEAVTPSRYLFVRIAAEMIPPDSQEDDTIYFVAIDPMSYRQVADMEFAVDQGDPDECWARLAQGGAVFISTVIADRFDLRQGDSLRLVTRRGEQEFTIAAVVVDFTGQGYIVHGTYDDMARWFAESGVDRFTLGIAPGFSIDAVADEIESRFKSRRNINTQTTEEFKTHITGLMTQSFQMFDILNFIGVIIGALGVINTLTMNVIERQREIGALRSLGMIRHQVLRMVLAEALTLGAMGGIYGLIFGYVIAQIMIWAMNVMNGYDLVYVHNPQPYLIGTLIALAIAQGAALFPARRAARVNIVEAIKHE